MISGRESRARSCTARAWPPTGKKTRLSAGSRSATPPTTSIWSQSWPAKTAPGPGYGTTTTASARLAGPPRTGSGCAAPPPRDRTAARRPTRAEAEKARRQGWGEPPRVTLRRAVATAAAGVSCEREFFARLDAAGVKVRKRFSTRTSGEVTGYAVSLPTDTTDAGGPVWYSGGKLAPDLTLPKLRRRWPPAATATSAGRFTAAERSAVYEHAARAARDAAQQIRHHAATDPGAAADAAWAAADTLHAAANTLDNSELRRAADAYDRAARYAYGRVPRPTPAGNRLRTAARALAAVAIATGDPLIAQLRLILQLAALTEAVIDLRTAQRHAAQAGAARAAAERLYAARRTYTAPPGGRTTARAQGNQAARDFPISIQQVLAEASAEAHPPEPAAASRPSRGPAPPRQRGPTR